MLLYMLPDLNNHFWLFQYIRVTKEDAKLWKWIIECPAVKRFSNFRLTCFLHSYKNVFCPTLQIEPSYLLVLSHNHRKYGIDVMHSDSFRFAKRAWNTYVERSSQNKLLSYSTYYYTGRPALILYSSNY
jgi:hypothetical protein